MGKDQAAGRVQEIKHDSPRRFDRLKYWVGPLTALLAIGVCDLMPFLTPVIAIGLIFGGVITWRRATEPFIRAVGLGFIAIGVILLLLTLLVIIGLFHASSTTIMPAP